MLVVETRLKECKEKHDAYGWNMYRKIQPKTQWYRTFFADRSYVDIQVKKYKWPVM